MKTLWNEKSKNKIELMKHSSSLNKNYNESKSRKIPSYPEKSIYYQFKFNDDTFAVNEIFESIQGEGPHSGLNSLFIRFQFCNLRCKWCDTKYTWKNSETFYNYTLDDLSKIIHESNKLNIILTGGEPTLYRIDKLYDINHTFHVETNGLILPTKDLNIILKDSTEITRQKMNEEIINNFIWVVSPKLSNTRQKYDFSVINYWKNLKNVYFKFIIKNINDLDEIDEITKTFSIPQKTIFIGIEGINIESQLKKEFLEEIIKRNYNFSPRLHIFYWGNERKR